ncbi:dTDP-4-amino-4,6-dideoxy-D-galactose acyltransferase [Amycolatopsis panacis]|uniref:dTDP-4-amino-4,6-dideoxy-D-galactose acyltransferase n=1 Tax=Amycolatopsis panacis TaxID=2340917 RepID=A0A419I8D2_9PSEU|nr:dTDP-4-amino-4,6-dideoxy-D-galactose acyltransferase [Amycolatopsis panacis]RJQ88414.1 dTDP-4-amino-4,6-dideoxy-D-galactose acyltransferase [Amycolatopsis panacis]
MGVHAEVVPLDWASEFFAMRCARLVFSAKAGPLTLPALRRFDVVEAKIGADRPGTAAALEALGFRDVEGAVDFVLPVPGKTGSDHVPAGAADIPRLREIVPGVFRTSRFRPPWYTEAQRDDFYRQWLENAVHGSYDDECLLVREDGDIAGYVTVRRTGEDSARVGLLAAAPGWTGRGIGGRLVAAAQHWCAARGVRRLTIVTQPGNLAAIRCYQAHGGVVSAKARWMYR